MRTLEHWIHTWHSYIYKTWGACVKYICTFHGPSRKLWVVWVFGISFNVLGGGPLLTWTVSPNSWSLLVNGAGELGLNWDLEIGFGLVACLLFLLSDLTHWHCEYHECRSRKCLLSVYISQYWYSLIVTKYWGTLSSSFDTLVLVVLWVITKAPQPSHTQSSKDWRSLIKYYLSQLNLWYVDSAFTLNESNF